MYAKEQAREDLVRVQALFDSGLYKGDRYEILSLFGTSIHMFLDPRIGDSSSLLGPLIDSLRHYYFYTNLVLNEELKSKLHVLLNIMTMISANYGIKCMEYPVGNERELKLRKIAAGNSIANSIASCILSIPITAKHLPDNFFEDLDKLAEMHVPTKEAIPAIRSMIETVTHFMDSIAQGGRLAD